MRVLFTNAGRRTYLIEFMLSLADSGYPVEVFASDCTPYAPSLHISDRVTTILTPSLQDGNEVYAEALLRLARECAIDVVIPLSDLDLMVLAEWRRSFADCGITVMVSSPETVARCMDKRLMYDFCLEIGLPVPRSTFTATTDFGLPCVIKDICGSGSSGMRVVRDQREMVLFEDGRSMMQEFVAGTEFGIDVLNDFDGVPLSVCVKRKILMRAGETDRSEVVMAPDVAALALRAATALRHVGNLDIDIIKTKDGTLYCLDFNPRFGGGYPATHLAGFDYLKAVLDMAMGRPVSLPETPRRIVLMKGISLHTCMSIECASL